MPTLTRRNLLKWGLVLAGASVAPSLALAKTRLALPERALAFYNTHTGETLRTVYWAQDEYLADSLAEINHILRDHRTNETTAMEARLLDLLFALQGRVENTRPFEIISGYRSPASNAALAVRSDGVASKSLHMQGMAIDIRLPGCALKDLRDAALALRAGGVGYYPKSDFVHIDTGRVRRW
ncbi:MAG: DUF882 domain-containing protein [Pseudomonadota bacterium]